MQIVQPVKEISYVTSKYWKHTIITVLANEYYEVYTHLIEKFFFRYAKYLWCEWEMCSIELDEYTVHRDDY